MRIPTRSASDESPAASAPSSGTPADVANSRRRRFLFTLGVGSAGVAVSAKTSVAAVAEATEPQQETADGRYRETEHVRDYYRTAKL